MEQAYATIGIWIGVGLVGSGGSTVATIAVAAFALAATHIIWEQNGDCTLSGNTL